MPPSDLDITRTAHLCIQQHGEQATAKARERVEEMRRKGDSREPVMDGMSSAASAQVLLATTTPSVGSGERT